jgi:hypothetical protein
MQHVAAGPMACIKVTKDASAKTTALVKNIVHHLNAPTGLKEYNVARHHWNLLLLQDLHLPGSKKSWSKPLSSKEAKKFGIYEQCDQLKDGFCQSPNIPAAVVRGYVAATQQGDRKLGRQENKNKKANQLSTCSNEEFTKDCADDVTDNFEILPVTDISILPSPVREQRCVGLQNDRVNKFAEGPTVNRGYCLTFWDYSKSEWRNQHCEERVFKPKTDAFPVLTVQRTLLKIDIHRFMLPT